jgi:hypothetical protein
MKKLNRFLLPAVLLLSFGVAHAQLEWTPFTGQLPDNAVVGGSEN